MPDGYSPSRLSRRRLLASGAALAALGCAGVPRALARRAGDVAREVLPNGLIVVVEERRSADTVAFQLTARAGSRDDADLPSVNVLTSRMMLQGTPRRPSETALQRIAAAVGGSLARGTETEIGYVTLRVPSGETELAFDLIADVAANPLLDPAALARQQRIALQDLQQRRATPNTLVGDLFDQTIYAGHPAGIPPLGTPETINAVTPAAIRATYARLWNASNLVLAVVGRIRPEEAIERAHAYFDPLPTGAPNDRPRTPAPPRTSPDTVRAEAGQQQAVFRYGFQAPSLLDDDRYALQVLNELMIGFSGRLLTELRSKRGLVYTAGSAYSGLSDTGAWYATAGADPRNLDQALDVTRAEVQRLRETPPSPDEVALKINEIAGSQILADETNANRAARLSRQEILGTPPTETVLARIRQIAPADIQRVAQSYLDPNRAVLAIVGPPAS